MMNLFYCIFLCVSFSGVISSPAKTQRKDAIGFPELEEDSRLKNKDNRQPVFLPSMCPENELYYPGDQKNDWICDCRPAHIYHPPTDKCWPTWYQGPCVNGEHLYLPEKTVIPTCQKNPCFANGYVYWNGTCQQLGTMAPCIQQNPTSTILGVNAATLQVECITMTLDNRFNEPEATSVSMTCPPGTKRSIQKKCVPS